MSAERNELRELVEQLPEERGCWPRPVVISLSTAGERPWPPAFFGAGRAGRGDVAARSEEILDEGFGRPA